MQLYRCILSHLHKGTRIFNITMGLILNIETATQICSVALSKDGKTISFCESNDTNSHASQLTVLIQKLLKTSDVSIEQLDAVAVSKGPGSYTGLRIGVSTAKGICFGANIPLIAIDTLTALANGVRSIRSISEDEPKKLLCPLIDARRMEVYTSVFKPDLSTIEEVNAKIIDDKSFLDILDKYEILFFGNGAEKCKETITHKNALFIDKINNSADFMSDLSEKAFQNKDFEDLAYFEPFYLKDFVATIPKKTIFQ